jgi:hypothetical protein
MLRCSNDALNARLAAPHADCKVGGADVNPGFVRGSCVIAAALLAFASALSAQQRVDVVSGTVYLNRTHTKEIYRIEPGSEMREVPGLVPEKLGFLNKPRPKVRLGCIWISNGERLYRRPLDAAPGQGWETLRLPDGMDYFGDFEILSDEDALVCGAAWKSPEGDENAPIRFDLHFVFNYRTGAVKRTVEEIDPRLYRAGAGKNGYERIKARESYLCRFGPNILIVGCASGKVTVLDADGRKGGEFQVVPAEDFPADPQVSVNGGDAIPWVGPLADGAALICCRRLVAPEDVGGRRFLVVRIPDEDGLLPPEDSSLARVYHFRTLDLKTGRVKPEGATYRGFEAWAGSTLFEMGGELLCADDMLPEGAGRG